MYKIFDNVTLYFVTFPEGGNNAFMGYLQKYYKGEEQAIDITENISWSRNYGTGISIYNKWEPKIESQSFNNPVISDEHLGEELLRLWGKRSRVWTQQNGITSSINQQRKEWVYRLAEKLNQMNLEKYKTLEGITSAIIYTHYLPIGIEGVNKYFKNVKHLLAVNPTDLDTAYWCERLKDIKKAKHSPTERELLEKSRLVTRRYNDALDLYPAETNIDYNKFFFDRDEQEIKKFFLGTVPGEFKYSKLEKIKKMIKAVTDNNIKLTKQKDIQFTSKFQHTLEKAQ